MHALPPLQAILDQLARDSAEQSAWQSLYQRLWPYVFAIVSHRTRGDYDLAEDLSQEVFFRLLRLRPFDRVSSAEDFRRYLRRMALNVVRDEERKALRRAEKHLKSLEQELSAEYLAEHQSSELEAKELLDDARRPLSDDEVSLLELILAGASLAGIAGELGITYSAAGVRVHRLRRKIRQVLNED